MAVDQLAKFWVVTALELGEKFHLIWLLDIKLGKNYGAILGIGGGDSGILFFSISILIMVAFLALIFLKSLPSIKNIQSILMTRHFIAFALIVGGAIGNAADRVFRSEDGFADGGVVDFVKFGRWPVFNLADSSITAGIILLVIFAFIPISEKQALKKETSEGTSITKEV